MSPNTKKRIALYGAGLLLLAGLAWGGFVYEAEPDFDQLVNSAEANASYGLPDEGIRWAERALRMKPDDRYVHLILAQCYLRKQDFDRAAEYYQRGFDLTPVDDPNREVLVLHRAEALAAGDRMDEAIREASTVTGRSPDLLSGWYVLGRLHLRRGDHGKARTAFREAAERAPDDFEPLALLAAVAEEQGNGVEARTLLLEAERRVAVLSGAALAEFGDAEPTVENLPRRREIDLLMGKHAEIELGLARLLAAEGAASAAEDRLVAAAGLSRRATSRSLREEKLFLPFRESARLRAALAGTAAGSGGN